VYTVGAANARCKLGQLGAIGLNAHVQTRGIISHRQANNNLTPNSYLGSFKVMKLRIKC